MFLSLEDFPGLATGTFAFLEGLALLLSLESFPGLAAEALSFLEWLSFAEFFEGFAGLLGGALVKSPELSLSEQEGEEEEEGDSSGEGVKANLFLDLLTSPVLHETMSFNGKGRAWFFV